MSDPRSGFRSSANGLLLPAPAPPPRGLPRPGSLDLWLLRVSDARGTGLDTAVLDADECQRAAGLAYAEDRIRFTAAHLTLRRLLGTYLDMLPQDIRYGREACPCCGGPHGRPTVLGATRGLHFSLSHRGDLVLVGTAAAPIGVDVDLVPDPGGAAELATMLHPAEQREIEALPSPRRPRALARLWTRKEAYLKGLGTGLGRDPAADYVGSGSPEGPLPPVGWTLLDIAVDRGYAAAVAFHGELTTPSPRVNRLSGCQLPL
ncbi:4'-phosphopantetheinyl transferase superfamily protein [Streptomyces sp. NBC_01754]|uniref:4'-phosphopantetheinyl transferase family protein n=1 Tax=Streptomyces sp. NBC_01754 TaxID=2975930 RepID=UPI002DD88D42|nr:4'-phosphopantetheinyl transferase superfamily protein [Streptomyces sp. NBC_01754]WSC90849.1 4'-phosphopantetheinyl transferase superfamily protein [Streptomyces sp. NBC_01754]WSC96656.1 4'-phosphopantetheinyl transferase superfamily protein [Streptomyces sp. NBC_01754]